MANQTQDVLTRLGLTQYGARAYEALVGLGPSPADTVSEAAQIPRTKTYAVLDELVERDWATMEEGRPRTYHAVDPVLCVDRARATLLDGVDGVRDALSTMYRQEGVRFAGPMWILEGARAVVERAVTMVTRARHDVLMAYGFPVEGDDALFDALLQAPERGVHVRMMLAQPEMLPDALRQRLRGDIRIGIPPIRNLFVDGTQALAAFREPRADGSMEAKALWNPHAEMVAYLSTMHEQMWSQARVA